MAVVIEANPVLSRRYRGGELESLHRGCWALVSTDGQVLAGAGDPDQMIFARSASKSMQACGVLTHDGVNTDALPDEHVAIMVSSHNGEQMHVDAVRSLLAASGLADDALRCGEASPIGDPTATQMRVQHNCSGKHAGFLTGAVAMAQDPASYLDPAGPVQQAIREAVVQLSMVDPEHLHVAIDGCSAPTFAMPMRALGRGIANVASPSALAPELASVCHRIVAAAGAHPALVAGRYPSRFDTALLEASGGRLFAKGGADGVQVVGVVGAGVAFVGKVDDGNARGLHPVVADVLGHIGALTDAERAAVAEWAAPEILNADGLVVGEHVTEPIVVGSEVAGSFSPPNR